jgi:hypothetical protein
MGEFTFVNIFATKGIEYLLVISALLLFIPFWRLLTGTEEEDFDMNPSLGMTMADGGEPLEKKEDVSNHPAIAALKKVEEDKIIL